MTVKSSKCVVVGAGISGLSAAVLLARQHPAIEVEVWESSEQVGGLLAPIAFCGIGCDRGSHRVHRQADPLLLELTQAQQWRERPRQGKLILNRRQINYPPKLTNFLQGLGLRTSFDMGLGFLLRPKALQRYLTWEQDRGQAPRQDEGFEQFVVERVGYAAYQQFYRPYVEKVWGVEPAKISRTVAKQRVSTSSPWQTLLGALQQNHRQSHQSFLYPRYGMAGLITQLRQTAEELGVKFIFGRKVDAESVGNIDASAVFFSGHLSDITPQSQLHHRGLYLLYLALSEGSIHPVDTYYTPESAYWFGRVSQLEQFSPDLKATNKHILCIEIPEGRWGASHNFLEHLDVIRQQLRDAGIVTSQAAILDSHQTYIPRVYPLYYRGWFERWREALITMQKYSNIFPIGRQGLFLHCNMDHCVRISQDAVHHFSQTGHASAWLDQLHRYLDLRVRD